MMMTTMMIIFSISSYSVLVIAFPIAKQLCRPDQRDALLEFKSEFYVNANGNSTGKKTEKWRNNTDCCSWDGISCDPKTGYIVELDLWSVSLNGPLRANSSLFRLLHLQSLILESNNLTGYLPDSIGNLRDLKALNLGSCNLFGKIPSLLGNLSYLTSLVIFGNGFTGELPDSIGNLKRLTELQIQNNKFGGSFPLVLLNLSSLTMIHLGSNRFEGTLPSVFPKFLQNLTRLYYLDISANRIEGQVPEWLWSLPGLRYVNISHNSFTGFQGSLDVIRRRGAVELLDITSNSFQNPFPLLPNSTVYLLGSNNRFSGEIPRSICQLVSLQMLDLSNNNFSGSIPRCFCKLNTTLWVLHLQNNNLSGIFPEESIGVALKSLNLGHNKLSGRLPKSLANCTKLELLNVEHNRFNDTFPSWLRLLPILQMLLLRSNEFHGPISYPGDELRFFDISENRFDGVLPSDYFAGWTEITSVVDILDTMTSSIQRLYGTSVVVVNKGLIMELVWSSFEMYKVIDLSRNIFEGGIPESIGLLNGLIVLNMSNNAFTSRIPTSLTNLTSLESLDLSHNALSGQIPPELGKLTFLSRLNFSYNKLEGPIPQGTQIQSQDNSSFVGNLALCGVPLQEAGKEEEATKEEEEEEEEDEEVISWIAAAIGYLPGVFCGLTIAHILASSYKLEWFFIKIFRCCT